MLVSLQKMGCMYGSYGEYRVGTSEFILRRNLGEYMLLSPFNVTLGQLFCVVEP
jgi:hypothetical protein